MAQVWENSAGPVYTFVEANDGSATAQVSYQMPNAYAGIAVGWTNYNFEPNSRTSIKSTQTYLDPDVFCEAQANNSTARQLAFWLATHELGRVLGLGSILGGNDIMDPMATPARAQDPPMLSTLHVQSLKGAVIQLLKYCRNSQQEGWARLIVGTNNAEQEGVRSLPRRKPNVA
jgi:hypothetical protein